MVLARRDFLIGAGAASTAFALLANPIGAQPELPTSELLPDPHRIIDLPRGFAYQVISRAGEAMGDGLVAPDRPDGMASFALSGDRYLLLRNHENGDEYEGKGCFSDPQAFAKASFVYDRRDDGSPHLGGVTGLIWNTKTARLEQSWAALAGTQINCSGGPTPWGSWISCEESVVRVGENAQKDHGYNFEIPAVAGARADPEPLTAMGRFRHEGVAIDPRTGIAYQTEDRKNGLIYRFLPNEPGQMSKGGRLQALAIIGQPARDTRNWTSFIPTLEAERFPPRVAQAVTWIDLDNVDSPDDDLRLRGQAKGAAIFARGEGIWFGNNELYFTCTIGGANESGQIWRYRPSRFEGTSDEQKNPGALTLWSEPGDATLIDRCDNITIHPSGALVICEDGKADNYVRILSRNGEWRRVARNTHPNSGEMTGACFTPDGKTMFINQQEEGLTLAITGPWNSLI